MDELTVRIQALPAELIDRIYDETFTAEVQTINMSRKPQPPTLLHVDTTSRGLFAQSYYSNTTFSFKCESDCLEWIDMLPCVHQGYLLNVSVSYCDRKDAVKDLGKQYSAVLNISKHLAQQSLLISAVFLQKRSQIKPGVLRLDNTFADALKEAQRREDAQFEELFRPLKDVLRRMQNGHRDSS